MTATYRFGPIAVHSTVELPELAEVPETSIPAVAIAQVEALEGEPARWYHVWNGAAGDDWLRIGRDERGYRLEFPGLAEFALTHDGCSVRARRLDASPATFRHLLLDQVLPLVLSHQGWCVLHAAAVAGPDGGAAFLGTTGRGKSTMTASLAASGVEAITDDTLILTATPGCGVTGHPAYPSIRVWPETAQAIFGPGCRHEGLVSDLNDKVRVGPSGGVAFVTAGAPLRVLYVLAPDAGADAPRVEAILPRDRIMEVVRHAFVLDWQGTERLRAAFNAVSSLVDQVAVRRLRFRHDYAELPALRQAILDDLAHARDRPDLAP